MGIYTLLFFGGTPLGAPVIGWAADAFGARSGLVGGGAITAVLSAAAALAYWRRRTAPAETDAAVPAADVPR